jgi:glutamate 5-kinase
VPARTAAPTSENLRERARLASARRVVIKIGSRVLSCPSGVDEARVDALCGEVEALRAAGREAVVVTSGAIACGTARLGLKRRPRDLPRLQAAAAAGQIALMRIYESSLARRGLTAAQILLTHADFADRKRYLNAGATLRTLLDFGAVPVVNENDTVATAEIRFGDNDALSAEIASLLAADLLVLLTDVGGLFDADPRRRPDARRVPLVRDVAREALPLAAAGDGLVGTGGMASKVAAAEKAARSGIRTVIADGRRLDVLAAILQGEDVGTLVLASAAPGAARKRWIAFTLKPKGRLTVDDGAAAALVERGKSLLPSGVRAVEGEFQRGEPVSVRDARGKEIARGLSSYDANDLRRILGKKTAEAREILGFVYEEAIHRDDLVILS